MRLMSNGHSERYQGKGEMMSWAAHDPEGYSMVLRNAIMRKYGVDPSAEVEEFLDLVESDSPKVFEALWTHALSELYIAESDYLLNKYAPGM